MRWPIRKRSERMSADSKGRRMMDFGSIFLQQQKVLALELELARTRFTHLGVRGGAVEIAMRDFLERHLPRSLTVGTGEVIATKSDNDDRRSRQLDIVISNMMQPFSTQRDTPTTFLIESVYAAGEIKAQISRSSFKDELPKAAAFRSLQAMNLSRFVSVSGKSDWVSYFVHYRPYFMISMETKSDWRGILLELMSYIDENKKLPLDAVFLLDKNIVILVSPVGLFPGLDKVGIPFTHIVDGNNQAGSIVALNTNIPLAVFMFWIGLFQIGFGSDNIPIGSYLIEHINSSLEGLLIAEFADGVVPLMNRMQSDGVFKLILDSLRTQLAKK